MSAILELISSVAISAAVLVLLISPAHSQEINRPLTLADCPRGYVLGVQDTADPQPVAHVPSEYSDNSESVNANATAYEAEAPRRFITGCIPPNQPQIRQPTGVDYEQQQ